MYESFALNPEKEIHRRRNSVLATFNIDTNRHERQAALEACLRNKIQFIHKHDLPRNRYQATVTNSLFVLSPPGHGLDCHRTWEAIYLGAVPVVKKNALARSLYSQLPIFAVESWEEVCSLNRDELESVYLSLRQKALNLAKLETWAAKL
jgi:hypothetical protein